MGSGLCFSGFPPAAGWRVYCGGGMGGEGQGEAGATILLVTRGQQRGGEKWSYSCHIMKVEPKGFAEGSGVVGERKVWGGKDDSQVFD